MERKKAKRKPLWAEGIWLQAQGGRPSAGLCCGCLPLGWETPHPRPAPPHSDTQPFHKAWCRPRPPGVISPSLQVEPVTPTPPQAPRSSPTVHSLPWAPWLSATSDVHFSDCSCSWAPPPAPKHSCVWQEGGAAQGTRPRGPAGQLSTCWQNVHHLSLSRNANSTQATEAFWRDTGTSYHFPAAFRLPPNQGLWTSILHPKPLAPGLPEICKI